MNSRSKTRIIGAFVIGFAVVAGAYTINSLSGPTSTAEAMPVVTEAPDRTTLEVKDSNSDGVEDWQEEFISTTLVLDTSNSTDEEYELPDTVTGKTAISLIQRQLSAKTAGPLGNSQEEIVDSAINDATKLAQDKLYSIKDIILSEDESDNDIRRYANALANAITENNIPNLENKFLLLNRIVGSATPNQEDLDELRVHAEIYLNTKNSTLNIPVPKRLLKEHLDLINVYHAMYKDIDAMSKVHEDPLLTLIRIKRYEEDAEGASLALQNVYTSLLPFSDLFEENDPANLFVVFSPDYVKQ